MPQETIEKTARISSTTFEIELDWARIPRKADPPLTGTALSCPCSSRARIRGFQACANSPPRRRSAPLGQRAPGWISGGLTSGGEPEECAKL